MHLVGEYPNLKVVAQLLLLLLSAFPFNQGWPQRIIILQTFLSSTAVSFAPTSPISSFTTSTNLRFRLPLLLFPGNSISIIFLPTYSWSLLMTCPYYLSLPSLIFTLNRFTLTLEGPSASFDAFKFLQGDKSRFLMYYRFILFDFYFFIGRHSQTKFRDLRGKT